jgi:Protein of unknown function (DUF4019)
VELERKSKMKTVRTIFAILIVFMPVSAAFAQNASAKQEAQKSGLQWLGTIDGGNYATSYDDAAAMFKAAVTQKQWVHSLDGVRASLGNVASRQLLNATYATSLPGAPDGEYVVMQFNSSFQNKREAVETLTMVLEKDGQWRSTGYFIK